MKTTIRPLRVSELVILVNEESYPARDMVTMKVTNNIRSGMQNIYGIFNDTGLIGCVSVFYKVTLFGMQLEDGTVQLYDLWMKEKNIENEQLLLDAVMNQLKKDGYKQVLVAINHLTFDDTQTLQRVGIREVVGSYKSDFMDGKDMITVFGKVI